MCELIIKLPFSKNKYKIYILLYKSNDLNSKCAKIYTLNKLYT